MLTNTDKAGLIFNALDSHLRREFLDIAKRPMSVPKIYDAAKGRGYNFRYRESVYRDLNILVEAELMDKFYDKDAKSIVYKTNSNQIVYDTGTVSVTMLSNLNYTIDGGTKVYRDKTGLVFRALNSKIKRELMKIAAARPMSRMEFYKILLDEEFGIVYDESVYKILEELVKANLLMKKLHFTSLKRTERTSLQYLYGSNADKVITDTNTLEVVLLKNP